MTSEASNKENDFVFAISLTVLEHLGRSLYRNFITVLGEAISNAWDADAENVWIHIDEAKKNIIIKDDGHGMGPEDFKNKFLKIGYSKRKDTPEGYIGRSPKNRPLIGRKGIGKLALLSCAEYVDVISKTELSNTYTGGQIINKKLDEAIDQDLESADYKLDSFDMNHFDRYLGDHNHGTIIYLGQLINEPIGNIDSLKKHAALSFRFSLIDPNFRIFINDELLSVDNLRELISNTQFLWIINGFQDDFTQALQASKDQAGGSFYKTVYLAIDECPQIRGFVASAAKPRNLAIYGAKERIGIDVIANGRVRETNIARHAPTSQIPEQYMYGHIHYDDLDGVDDHFVSSREGLKMASPVVRDFLKVFEDKILKPVVNQWDALRLENNEDGDSENKRKTVAERSALSLYNETAKKYTPLSSDGAKLIKEWTQELKSDATYQLSAYTDCFISENLIRAYIHKNGVPLSDENKSSIDKYKEKEKKAQYAGGVNIEIRKSPTFCDKKLTYLEMSSLAKIVDPQNGGNESVHLTSDAKTFAPMRNALMHTAVLTNESKNRLLSTRENIQGRIRNLLDKDSEEE